MMKLKTVRWPVIVLVIIAAAALSYISTQRLAIDTDITKSLPPGDPVVRDAQYVMDHHPIRDRIALDLQVRGGGIQTLLEGAALVERRLEKSGLFRSVGMKEYQTAIPDLIARIIDTLPVLFSEDELNRQVLPMLEKNKVREIMRDNVAVLANLDGIGQSRMMASDPLGLKNLVLARLAHLVPSSDVRIIDGRLVSRDGSHLLITAEPKGSATDTVKAREIASLISSCAGELREKYSKSPVEFMVTPVGAYRAAIDNEDTAKSDTRLAIIFATLGITILLLVGFPRPYLGVLALVPAILGTIAATFVFSFFSPSISILTVGFGGTIISFTVDYGIAYLLFLDRPHETRGGETTREVWSLGMLAMLTTAVSFAFLFLSGFSILGQIGAFASLGVVCTFIIVHTLFPLIFPVMPPARRVGLMPMQKYANALLGSRLKYGPIAALLVFIPMLFFARPDFTVDLSSMNTVSSDTLRAEEEIVKTWGNVLGRLYLMSEADTLEHLQEKGDRIAADLEKEIGSGVLSGAFAPSMVFPGRERRAENLMAWKKFWTRDRVAALRRNIEESSRETGFSPGAFQGFFRTVVNGSVSGGGIPQEFHTLLGIHRRGVNGQWAFFSVLTPGPSYKGAEFYTRISRSGIARLFDPVLFGERLGETILSGFVRMALIIGAITIAVALIYLRDLKLSMIAMAPTVFSLVCTLGTMNIAGMRPGIATIMVTVIVIGMGTDYALYLVSAYKKYVVETHPSIGLIRLTVLLSAMSTIIGFGVLSIADHALLRNAGLTLLMGIGYSFLGAVLIVTPLLGRFYGRSADISAQEPPVF